MSLPLPPKRYMAAAKSFQTKSCPTLCNPMDCSPPGSSICGICQARVLEWVAIAFSDPDSKARQKLERQYVIEENSAKMVLSRAIDNAIGTWRKDNPKNIAVLSSGVVLAHNESADITKEVMTLVEKENLVFNKLPKVEVRNKDEEKPEQSK